MFSLKVLFVVSALLVVASALPSDDLPVLGGVRPLTGDDLKAAEESLQTSLTKLAAGDGPNYKISKVNSATKQVVSGSLTKLDCVLIDGEGATKECLVEIWSQPWLDNGNQVTFNCKGEEQLVKKHGN